MIFVETTLFTRLLCDYLSDDEYRSLQSFLIRQSDAGALIRGSGGVRKVRWRAGGKGKSGGVRVIYYWAAEVDQIFMLTIYGKGEKEDLSAADLRKVTRLLGEITNG